MSSDDFTHQKFSMQLMPAKFLQERKYDHTPVPLITSNQKLMFIHKSHSQQMIFFVVCSFAFTPLVNCRTADSQLRLYVEYHFSKLH